MINDIFGSLKAKKFFNYKIILLFAVAAVIVLFLSVSVSASGSSTPRYKYYKSVKIEAGDTLWSIAEEYISDDYDSTLEYIREVKFINSISTDKITVGKYLIIPYYSSLEH